MNSSNGFLAEKRLERGSWRAFERAVARLFVHRGWSNVAVVGGPGDHGADVIASNEGREVLAQMKFKSSPQATAGKKIVKDVKRAMEFYDIPAGICVTNTRLADSAERYRKKLLGEGYQIQKVEGHPLLEQYRSLDRWPNNDLEPYNYQKEPINFLHSLFQDNRDRALLSLATGLGKTFVAGRFIRRVLRDDPDKRILILADQRALIKQFEKSLWNHVPKDVSTHLWFGNESPKYDSGIDIGTFQTLNNTDRLSREEATKYDLVIVDEAHHAAAESYRRVIDRTEPDFLLGLTATPWREDDKSLEDIFGPTRERLTIDVIEALRKGYLTEVDYRLYCDDLDWEQIQRESQNNYSIKDLNKSLFIQVRDDEIINEFQSVWGEENCERSIVYCASIDHADQISQRLRDRGYGARQLHSGLQDREVERRLRAFRRGDLEVLTAVDMLNEGVDIPEVDLIVFLRVTHSRRIFLQQLGRGLRLSERKDKVVVMDLVADIRRIAETVDINRNLEKGDNKEMIHQNFNLHFLDQQAQSFFSEYLADKGAISTKSSEEKVRFP